ncbi:MAG: hypothetical protein K8R77_04995, partial [Anaerolineaceae bacterium]|nr:hypothetical protein [Anaerolineaceae bacterium]
GMITRVRKLLAGEGWVHTGPEGFALIQPQALLSDWTEQVDVQRNPLYRYHTPTNDIRAALAALTEVCNRQNIPWALTGPSAAARLLQQPAPRSEMVRIQGDVSAIAQVLGLRPSDEESELLLIETRDAGVFIGKTQSGPWPLVSPIQAVLDLQYLPQPAPLVNALIENHLMPRWTRCKEQFQT